MRYRGASYGSFATLKSFRQRRLEVHLAPIHYEANSSRIESTGTRIRIGSHNGKQPDRIVVSNEVRRLIDVHGVTRLAEHAGRAYNA